MANRMSVSRKDITIKKNRLAPAIPLILSNVEVGNGETDVGSEWGVEELGAVDVEVGDCDVGLVDVEIGGDEVGLWDVEVLKDVRAEPVGFENGEVGVEDTAAPEFGPKPGWTFGKPPSLVVVVYTSYAVKLDVSDATQANEDNVLEKGQYSVWQKGKSEFVLYGR